MILFFSKNMIIKQKSLFVSTKVRTQFYSRHRPRVSRAVRIFPSSVSLLLCTHFNVIRNYLLFVLCLKDTIHVAHSQKEHYILIFTLDLNMKAPTQQECIPVGCVPPAAVAVPGGLHQAPPDQTPPDQAPPKEQAPPGPGTPVGPDPPGSRHTP